MPNVTGLQRRDARSNQWNSYSNYDQTYNIDRLEVSTRNNTLSLFFGSASNPNLGVGIRIPLDKASVVAKVIEAVESGSGTIKIKLD